MTLSAAARGIGVSVPYWSDVEHGRRNPFTGEKLEAAARMLEADFDELHRLALSARRSVQIPLAERSPKQADLIVTFARTIDALTEPDLDEIHRILVRRRNGYPT